MTTRWPAGGVCAMTVPMGETEWATGAAKDGVVALGGDCAEIGATLEFELRLRSSALAMWRPADEARATAPESVSPAREGMTKASGEAVCSVSLRRRLTRGRSTPTALGAGVWAMTTPGSPGAAM